jgi:hypothetical protein
MSTAICDTTETAIFEFPGNGRVDEYLKANGLYPSSSYFYFRTQHKCCIEDEFEPDKTDQVGTDNVSDTALAISESSSPRADDIWAVQSTARVVCEKCSCTYQVGRTCIRCEQEKEYAESLASDSYDAVDYDIEEESFEDHPNMEQLRSHRLADLLGGNSSLCVAQNVIQTDQTPYVTTGVQSETSRVETEILSEERSKKVLDVHRSHVYVDMVEHFKKNDVMKSELSFQIINERGQIEAGVGVGVDREVYTLFWKDLQIQ